MHKWKEDLVLDKKESHKITMLHYHILLRKSKYV